MPIYWYKSLHNSDASLKLKFVGCNPTWQKWLPSRHWISNSGGGKRHPPPWFPALFSRRIIYYNILFMSPLSHHWKDRVRTEKRRNWVRKPFYLFNHSPRRLQFPKSKNNSINWAYLLSHINSCLECIIKRSWTKQMENIQENWKTSPITRQLGSGSMGLEPSFKERTKNSRNDAYSSRGSATSSKSEIQTISYFIQDAFEIWSLKKKAF